MVSRRQLFSTVAAGIGLTPLLMWLARSEPAPEDAPPLSFPEEKSEAEWHAVLSPQQYHVLRERGTERPFSSTLNHEKRHGTFVCVACGHRLFSSSTKYDSVTGWPSFWAPHDGAFGTAIDRSYFMIRTEVHCARCGGHLGHLFPDGPRPTGERYCMNGVAMRFVPEI